MNMKKVDLVGVQMDLGASKRGVNMGPAAIRYGGLHEGLTNLGIEWKDKGDIFPIPEGATSEKLKNYEQVIDINKKLYMTVTESLEQGRLPIVLGGDHSIAAGSIAAVANKYKNIGVIWIDAHGDWNSDESTLSGNMHGMPFSAVCGYGPDVMVDLGQESGITYVNPRNAVQIAGRDIDPGERIRMKEAGVTVFSIADVDRMGIYEVMRRAIEIAGDGTEGIHVSYDVDAITPEFAPGTGTLVHSGLTVREAFVVLELLYESKKILALDMVEVNPILDVKNRTGELAAELILSALGKTVY
ncbi:MAG: arginase [Aminipila sp.]